jgi:hypothetical protein
MSQMNAETSVCNSAAAVEHEFSLPHETPADE